MITDRIGLDSVLLPLHICFNVLIVFVFTTTTRYVNYRILSLSLRKGEILLDEVAGSSGKFECCSVFADCELVKLFS